MSKKRFSAGLDDLFNDSHAATDDNVEVAVVVTGAKPMERKLHGKNFVSNLDALLQEAMDETFERLETRQQAALSTGKTKSTAATNAGSRAPLSGLDALIRQTIDVREMTTDELGKKRLTVTVDKPKLDKLKTIARMENAFLKDILVKLIDGYIREYSNKKGVEI